MRPFFTYDAYTNSITLERPELLLMDTVYSVYKDDKSKNKSYTFSILHYVFLMYDYRSPYNDVKDVRMSTEEIQEKAIKTSKIDESIIDTDFLNEIIDEYCLVNKTITMKFKESKVKSAAALADYISDVDFTATDKKGELLHDPNKVATVNSKLTSLAKEIKELENIIDVELKEDGRSRGGKSRSPIEKGLFRK